MVHSSKTLVNPEGLHKASILLAICFSFALLSNTHSLKAMASSVFNRNTLHKIEAKGKYILNFGLTDDVVKQNPNKDLDNSFAQ